MIVVRNTQRKHKIDAPALQKKLAKVLEAIGYPDHVVCIWFTTPATIQEYNKRFRGKDKATDVISFPYCETKTPGVLPKECAQDLVLGDIMLCPAYINDDLTNWHQTLDERIVILIVHSICHLLGYDHETDVDYEVMSREEKRLMDVLKSR
jgi:probable rRNA maturation factor